MKRILVTGVGGPPGNNFVKSLREAPEPFYIVGTDINRYHLQWPDIDKGYLVPPCNAPDYLKVLNGIILAEGIDLVHPQPDVEVRALSENREALRARTYLPAKETIRILQDKLASARIWESSGIHVLPTVVVESVEDIERAATELGLPLWMRATQGAGARGSTLVTNVETGARWLGYWRSRGSDWNFIMQRYLPGRDYAFQSVWKEGQLVCSQARERLEYIYPYLAPSGRTGTPVVAVTVHREDLNRVATACVRAIAPRASGIFCVDLREDEEGNIFPTEVNAGRFFTTSFFFTKAGINMPYYYVKLGLGEEIPDLPRYNSVPAGLYWIRHIDCPAVLVKEDEFRWIEPRVS